MELAALIIAVHPPSSLSQKIKQEENNWLGEKSVGEKRIEKILERKVSNIRDNRPPLFCLYSNLNNVNFQ